MFGYCPGCDEELADIDPGEGVCLGRHLAEVRAEPQEERKLKKTALEARERRMKRLRHIHAASCRVSKALPHENGTR